MNKIFKIKVATKLGYNLVKQGGGGRFPLSIK